MARTKQTRRKNKKPTKQLAEPAVKDGSPQEATSVEDTLSKAFPYPTDSLDHAESPAKA